MAITEMSLPIDIPWKRMGVSKDMIDPTAGNLTFPQKWRSSISVFYHELTDIPPEYCNRKITYLKIVSTITNYQIEGDDVTVLDELGKQKYSDFYAWKNFEAKVTQSFPCYGALMQVGVYPNPAQGVALHDFPYISAFQPRKREMYEVLTESGEMASQSGNKLNVLKGTTNTETQEDYDLDLGGGGGGGHGGLFGLWSYQDEQKPQEQKGTIHRSQTENQNVINKDSSRDKRESHSHSTNINQLYTVLQGYHLGTNRAIFFLQPRPHMQDQKFTFIRGLRRLEGIQEFFLIIDRPASVPGICVEVALETAHAYLARAYKPRLIPLSELYAPGNLNKTAAALGLVLDPSVNYSYYFPSTLVDAWYLATPQDKLYAGLWPQVPPELAQHPLPDDFGRLLMVVEQVPEIGIEDIALIFEEYESDSGYFFVTGRRLCACFRPPPAEEGDQGNVECEQSTEDHISTCDTPSRSIVYSKRYLGRSNVRFKSLDDTKKGADLNAVAQDLNGTLWSSLGSAERSAYGELSFLETDFVLDELAQLIRLLKKGGIRDQALADVDGIRHFVEQGLGRASGARHVLDLGMLSTTQIARDLNLTYAEARKARRNLLLASLKALDAKTIRTDAVAENPIRERFTTEFPEDLLRELERSARGAGRDRIAKTTHKKSSRPIRGKKP